MIIFSILSSPSIHTVILVWVPLRAEPETRTRMRAVYPWGDLKKQVREQQEWNRDGGKASLRVCYRGCAVGSWGSTMPGPLRSLQNPLDLCTWQRGARTFIHYFILQLLRVAASSLNSPVPQRCRYMRALWSRKQTHAWHGLEARWPWAHMELKWGLGNVTRAPELSAVSVKQG